MSTDCNYLSLSSNALPDGMKVSVSHRRDFNAALPHEQDDYAYLTYEFSDDNSQIVTAKTYFDNSFKTSVYSDRMNGKLDELSPDNVEDLIKAAFLTLSALGYHAIDMLGKNGYEQVPLSKIGLEMSDVISWAEQMNNLEARNRHH